MKILQFALESFGALHADENFFKSTCMRLFGGF